MHGDGWTLRVGAAWYNERWGVGGGVLTSYSSLVLVRLGSEGARGEERRGGKDWRTGLSRVPQALQLPGWAGTGMLALVI